MTRQHWTIKDKQSWINAIRLSANELGIDLKSLLRGDLTKLGNLAMEKMGERKQTMTFDKVKEGVNAVLKEEKEGKKKDDALLYMLIEQSELLNRKYDQTLALLKEMLETDNIEDLLIAEIAAENKLPKVVMIGPNTEQSKRISETFKDTLNIRFFESDKAPSLKLLKKYDAMVIMTRFVAGDIWTNAAIMRVYDKPVLQCTGGTSSAILEMQKFFNK